MKKIPTLFERGDNHFVTRAVTPNCSWVIRGEGVATRKFDGTCCLIRGGVLYARREVHGSDPLPAGFELVERDPRTKKRFGWVPVDDAPQWKWHHAALEGKNLADFQDGTYELIGPKVQGNPEGVASHELVPHGCLRLSNVPLSFDGLAAYFGQRPEMEGIVWHHPDGRMCKIKRRDFCK